MKILEQVASRDINVCVPSQIALAAQLAYSAKKMALTLTYYRFLSALYSLWRRFQNVFVFSFDLINEATHASGVSGVEIHTQRTYYAHSSNLGFISFQRNRYIHSIYAINIKPFHTHTHSHAHAQ